jgi:hypothetical protein
MLIASLFGSMQSNASTEIQLASYVDDSNKIDPIITGKTINTAELENWKAKKKKFDACGLCGAEQAFPGDLPK